MNVYACWYHGIFGYGCRTRGRKWMFVPELGQPDDRIHRDLFLDDLIFRNSFDRRIELNLENKLRKSSILRFLQRLVFPSQKMHTVGGLLFSTT